MAKHDPYAEDTPEQAKYRKDLKPLVKSREFENLIEKYLADFLEARGIRR